MNICFCIDKKYTMPLVVCLVSLFKNNPNTCFNIYIINNGLDKFAADSIMTMSTKHNSHVNFIDINTDITKKFPVNHHISQAAYYRLLMDNFIPKTVDKILYLDVDIIINGSVSDLYATNIDEYVLGAVENPNFTRHSVLGMDSDAKYFNSGVLLINLKKWRDDAICQKTIDYINDNKEKLLCHDQCAINAVLNGKWFALSPTYNFQTSYLDKNPIHGYCTSVLNNAKQNPVIIHYTGSSKPWSFGNKHPYKNLFLSYLRQSVYKDYKYQDINLKNIIKRILPRFMSNFIIKSIA
jgi:lipopolysaccharide biosynthesis glycosyltransferase